MNKNLFYLLLVVALIVYLFWPDKGIEKTTTLNTNIISDMVVLQTSHNSKVKRISKVLPVQVNENSTFELEKDKDVEQKRKISYLQAYREYDFFQGCYWVIRVTQSGEDLDAVFKQKIKASAERLQQKVIEPAQKQIMAYDSFKNRCFDLMLAQDKSFNENKKLLQTKYQNIMPSTEEEKHLFTGLELYHEYSTLARRVYQKEFGELNLENPLVVNLKQKISNLKSELVRIQWEDGDFYENETKQLQARDLENAISKILKELNVYKSYDFELIAQLEDERDELLKQMVFLLKRNESPEVLLLLGKVLWSPFVEKKFNIDIFSELKIYDSGLAMSIYDAGMTLAACALNYPCDKDSLLVFNYCFNGFIIHNEACDKSVEDYLFTEVISPNQLQDVDNFINYVLNNYAKN